MSAAPIIPISGRHVHDSPESQRAKNEGKTQKNIKMHSPKTMGDNVHKFRARNAPQRSKPEPLPLAARPRMQ
jgi:hypothetical protein